MRVYVNVFNKVISAENLFDAWDGFKRGKGKRKDVLIFEENLEPNIFTLHRELKSMSYRHGEYHGFFVCDPKRRHIHKAIVRDRVLHHAVFSILNPIFESTFISTSFSCRIGKGTHRGVEAASKMLREESKNYTRQCYALKCDVRKFFDSVDHQILLEILGKRIKDKEMMLLLEEIVESYETGKSGITRERERERERNSVSSPEKASLSATLRRNFSPMST